MRDRNEAWRARSRAISRFFGVVIPIALIGAAAYSLWVITVTACGSYFRPEALSLYLLTSIK